MPTEPLSRASKRQKISHEQVALRAYSKWLERGCPVGDSETDWFEALQELEQEQRAAAGGRESGWFAAIDALEELEQDEPTLIRRQA